MDFAKWTRTYHRTPDGGDILDFGYWYLDEFGNELYQPPASQAHRLLTNARALVHELEREDWEGSTVRELVLSLQSILDEAD